MGYCAFGPGSPGQVGRRRWWRSGRRCSRGGCLWQLWVTCRLRNTKTRDPQVCQDTQWGLEAQPGAALDGYGYLSGRWLQLRLQREMLDTLDTRARARILRLRAVAENGVLELEGGDARTVQVAHGAVRTVPSGRHRRACGRRAAVPPPDFACTTSSTVTIVPG
jgi:hypothetical protein